MLLLLMRHGIAEEIQAGKSDAERALTFEGKKKTLEAARGLRFLIQGVDCVATSPLLRARETAEIARDVFAASQIEVWPELEYAEYSRLMQRFQKINAQTLLCIGHEPGFSRLAAALLTHNENDFALDFKKAGVCALELAWSTPGPNAAKPRAELLWHATPKMLRAIGEKST